MIGFVPTRPGGNSPRARWYQWVHDRLVRGQQDVYAGPGIKVTRTGRGMMVEALNSRGTEEAGSRVQQYLLIDASHGDYFICRTLSRSLNTDDPDNPFMEITIGDTDIYIARPYELRQSSFDRDVLNEEDPGAIGTSSEITRDVTVEAWDGATFSSSVMPMSFEYKSANYRIATDATDEDPDNWTTEKQTIIPRFVPAVLIEPEDGPVTTATVSPTIITATRCSGLGVTATVGDDMRDITLLADNDGWAWMKSTA